MQKRNTYTSIEDFMTDESFQRWVKYKDDTSNWESWTLESTERAKLVEEARLWLLAMKVEELTISPQEIQIALQSTLEKLDSSKNKNTLFIIGNKIWLKAIAAILVIGIISYAYFTYNFTTTRATLSYDSLIEEDAGGLIEQTNNSDKPQLITLSDASSILLQPQSKLSYPKAFIGNERKVYLSGEAFFEITKNPKKAFIVYANEVVTKVYGTSFRVIAFENEPNIEVMVRTGKVKVSSNSKIKSADEVEMMLLPNQAARFERKNLSFLKIMDITEDKPLFSATKSIEKLSFEFNDIPVKQIFATIEQAYLVKIDFPIEKLNDCYLTTSLSDEPLPEKLSIICESLGNNTRYEMNGNQITINTNGCK